MPESLEVDKVAFALQMSIGLLSRKLRAARSEGDLTLPEISALARLDRKGPTTSGALARIEQISPQSMGATLGALEARDLIERQTDPEDGRRVLLSVTASGLDVLNNRRNTRAQKMAGALATEFTPSEIRQLYEVTALIERLAQSF
jgi:DNA-binding MarR family transcriptional regulator